MRLNDLNVPVASILVYLGEKLMLEAQPSLAPACCVPFETMEWQHCLSVLSLRADQIQHLVQWVVRSIPYV